MAKILSFPSVTSSTYTLPTDNTAFSAAEVTAVYNSLSDEAKYRISYFAATASQRERSERVQ